MNNAIQRRALVFAALPWLASAPASAQRIVTVEPMQVQGPLPAEVVRRVVLRHLGVLRMCFENRLRVRPTLQGRVSIRFVIGRDGAVSHARDADSSLADATVRTCMIRVVRRLQFPIPEGATVTVLTSMVWTPPAA